MFPHRLWQHQANTEKKIEYLPNNAQRYEIKFFIKNFYY
jgi:hypothetical protein